MTGRNERLVVRGLDPRISLRLAQCRPVRDGRAGKFTLPAKLGCKPGHDSGEGVRCGR